METNVKSLGNTFGELLSFCHHVPSRPRSWSQPLIAAQCTQSFFNVKKIAPFLKAAEGVKIQKCCAVPSSTYRCSLKEVCRKKDENALSSDPIGQTAKRMQCPFQRIHGIRSVQPSTFHFLSSAQSNLTNTECVYKDL